MTANIPKFNLNAGVSIPAIGFGTWQIANGPDAKTATATAIEAGYRLIDTARIYGNEQSVGEAVRESGVSRNELFVTTKLWTSDQGYESAHKAFEESFERLGLDYIDLYLIHWPGRSSQNRLDSWRALQEIHKTGRSRAIGVSNFGVEHLQELAKNSITPPAVNQIEFNPFIYAKQLSTLDYCQKEGIVIEAYSPLARGRHTDNPVLAEIAKKHTKTDAQVMLRWAIQHNTVPIPKSVNADRIKANLDVFDFKLSDSEMEAINLLSDSKSSLPFAVRLLK